MSLVEIYLHQPVLVFSFNALHSVSRLGVLLHFADNTYNFNVFVSVLSVGGSKRSSTLTLVRLATTMLFVNTRVGSMKSAITGRFSGCSYIICRPFPHVNLGASLFERDLVHRQLHEMDATSVLRQEILDSHGIGNAACIKPLTLV
jgi:hypothetical protein